MAHSVNKEMRTGIWTVGKREVLNPDFQCLLKSHTTTTLHMFVVLGFFLNIYV